MRTKLFEQLRAELGDFVTLSPLSADGDHKATVPDDSLRMPSPKDPGETSAPIARGQGPKRKGDIEGHLRALSKGLDLVLDELARVDRRDVMRVQELEHAHATLAALADQTAEALRERDDRIVGVEHLQAIAEDRATQQGRAVLAACLLGGMALGAGAFNSALMLAWWCWS